MMADRDGVGVDVIGEYEVYREDGTIDEHTVEAYRIGEGKPDAVLVAGIHGDEIGPQYVADRLVDELAGEDLEGAVAVVPDANSFAQQYGERGTAGRFKPDAPEEGDLNRVFDDAIDALEGDIEREQLHLTQQLGHDLLSYLDDVGDDAYLIDMHSAAHPDRKMPQVRYKHGEGFEADADEMGDLARSAGLEYLLAQEVDPDQASMLAAAAPQIGVPAVTLEIGGAEKPYDDRDHFTEDDADLYEETVRNLLGHAGVLDVAEPGTEMQELGDLSRTYAGAAGDVVYHAELGEPVEEGETVATLYQDDEVVEEYVSRVDGVLEGRKDNGGDDEYDAWVTQGMRLFNVAELQE